MIKEKDMLFIDIFDKEVKFTDKVKQNVLNKKIRGNVRLVNGLYRTDEEVEQFVKESLERELP